MKVSRKKVFDRKKSFDNFLGATTFGIMAISITALSVTPLNIMEIVRMPIGMITFGI